MAMRTVILQQANMAKSTSLCRNFVQENNTHQVEITNKEERKICYMTAHTLPKYVAGILGLRQSCCIPTVAYKSQNRNIQAFAGENNICSKNHSTVKTTYDIASSESFTTGSFHVALLLKGYPKSHIK
jgi:hypothetical protein